VGIEPVAPSISKILTAEKGAGSGEALVQSYHQKVRNVIETI
jgi:hypothetical protein